MSSGLLSLKWNNHRSTFFHVLSSIRSKESYCDATLACDTRFYPVHKLVLSTCSEYFEQIFQRTDCKHPVIVLKDIRYDDLEALLNYMYVGEVNVMQEKLSSLITAAECLKIKGLAVPDEDPTKENKRTLARSDNDSPRAKRKKREPPIFAPESRGDQPDKNEELPSKHLVAKVSNGENETSKFSDDSSKDLKVTKKKFFETATESASIKTEPPDIPIIIPEEIDIDEEIDSKEDAHTTIHQSDFEYNISEEGNSLTGEDVETANDGNDSDFSNTVTESCNQDDPGSQPLPSSSNFQANSYSNIWESADNSQHYASDEFGGDSSQSQNMVPVRLEEKLVEDIERTEIVMPNLGRMKVHCCSYCPYKSTNRASVTTHMRIHTGDRPFSCVFCSKTFNVRSNLKRHVIMKHPGYNMSEK